MRSVKMLAESVGVDPSIADRWYVSDGAKAVGPVNLELIARGIEAGKVPLESFVRHEAWKVWRPLSEIAVVSIDSAAPTQPRIARGPATFAGMTDDITQPGRPVFPDEIMPADTFAGAADLDDALLLLMNAAVLRARADAALVHVVRPDGAVILYAHGAFGRDMLGQPTSMLDPVMSAAVVGKSIVAEPSPGPAGQALCARMLQLGVSCEVAFMLPVLVHGRLAATLEVGRKAAGLRVSELAAVEGLVDALVAKAEADGWF
jgi:GYF domain 2